MNILFTCAGRRNYLLDFFKEELNGEGLIMAADMQLSAPAMAVADRRFIVVAVYAQGYIDSLLKICAENKVNALISLNDLELPLLSERKAEFEQIGTKVIVADMSAIDIAFDKKKTVEFANSIGVKTPKTFTNFNDAVKALENGELSFPLVVKPRWGSASIGLEFPSNHEELELAYRLLSLRLSRTILAEASKSDFNNAILIQEKIDGIEYGVDVLNDFNGNTQQVYVKEKLAMRAGETDKSALRNKPQIDKIGFKIGNALKHIGNLDCDVFEKDNEYYLLELNPRFGGGYPFTHYSGGNYVKAIISWIKGETFDFASFKKDYDVIFSKCDTLIKVNYNVKF
jgi:carbamoyl-phosphate synthase large subunit